MSNNQWLDELIEKNSGALTIGEGDRSEILRVIDPTKFKQAILSKLESIEQEAYKKGYVDGGIEILNASCEVCHAYPMTAGCNNANCHAIER